MIVSRQKKVETSSRSMRTLEGAINHASIVSSTASIELTICGDEDCCSGKIHCPLCQDILFEIEEAYSHMNSVHLGNSVDTGEGWLILQCRLNCGIYTDVPHYHCSKCPLLFKAKEHIANHQAKICGKMRMKKSGDTKERHRAGLSQTRMKASERLSKLPFWHKSFMTHKEGLKLERCRTCCNNFHCPLCPDAVFHPTNPKRLSDHIGQVHIRHEIVFEDINILKCRLDCLENRSKIGEAHFHCPLCPAKMPLPERMKLHLRCHIKGTTKPRKRQKQTIAAAYEGGSPSDLLQGVTASNEGGCPSDVMQGVAAAVEGDHPNDGLQEIKKGTAEGLCETDRHASIAESRPGDDETAMEAAAGATLVASADMAQALVSVTLPDISPEVLDKLPVDRAEFIHMAQQGLGVCIELSEQKFEVIGSWEAVSNAQDRIVQMLNCNPKTRDDMEAYLASAGFAVCADEAEMTAGHEVVLIPHSEGAFVEFTTEAQQSDSAGVKDERCAAGRAHETVAPAPGVHEHHVRAGVGSRAFEQTLPPADGSTTCRSPSTHPSPPTAAPEFMTGQDPSPAKKSRPDDLDHKQSDFEIEKCEEKSVCRTFSGQIAVQIPQGQEQGEGEKGGAEAKDGTGGSSSKASGQLAGQPGGTGQLGGGFDGQADVDDQTMDEPAIAVTSQLAEEPEREVCPGCGQAEGASRADLLRHLLSSHCISRHNVRKTSLEKSLREQIDRMAKCSTNSCYMCKASFDSVSEAKIHYALKMCKAKAVKKNQHNIPRRPATGMYYCRMCGYEATIPYKIVVHMQRKHVEKCEPCDICGKLFSTKQFAEIHKEKIHLDKRIEECPICGQKYYAKYLKRHIADTHDKKYQRACRQKSDVDLKCDLCEYTSRYTADLQRHRLRKHSERHHACQHCPTKFALKQDLDVHVRKIHNPNRDLASCSYCGKTLLSTNLALHIRNVHQEQKDYTCKVCGKALQTKFSLNYHMETHKKPSGRKYRFRCPECGSGFMNKAVLRDHLNTHSGHRPYKCTMCEKAFRQRGVYHKHLEIHSNVKFMCALCGLIFSNKRAILEHRQTHHGKEAPINEDTASEQELEIDVPQGVVLPSALSVEEVAALLLEHGAALRGREVIQLDDGTMLVVQESPVGAECLGDEHAAIAVVPTDSSVLVEGSPQIGVDTSQVENDRFQVEMEASPVQIGALQMDMEASQVEMEASPVQIGASQVEMEASQVEIEPSVMSTDGIIFQETCEAMTNSEAIVMSPEQKPLPIVSGADERSECDKTARIAESVLEYRETSTKEKPVLEYRESVTTGDGLSSRVAVSGQSVTEGVDSTSGESYLCGYCSQLFQSMEAIQEHIVSRHGDQAAGDPGALQLHLQPYMST